MVAAWGGWSSPIAAELCTWMMHRDGDDHTRLRGLAGKAFHPVGIRLLRARMQGIVDSLLDKVLRTGGMDVIADLALPLPVAVIGELLGLSVDDHEQTGRWARAVGHAFDDVLKPEARGQAELAIEEITSYMRTKLGQTGGSGILSTLRAARREEQLSERELVSTANLLLLAGFETTRNLIGNGFLALLRHPEEFETLRARPDLLPNAVLELLRYDSPVQANRRVAREPLEVGGVEIAAGDKMLLLLGAANRDPARFVDPDRLDVARLGVRPLSFGGGVHFCLGAPLALLEAEVAISSLMRRLASVELAGPVEWADNVFLRGLEALPVTFTPASD
jgi:cytochrome P450